MRLPVKVHVIYKNGATMDFWCKRIEVDWVGSELRTVTWDDEACPKPLHFGIKEVAAIWASE